MQVLMITGVWPTATNPEHAPFVVRQVAFLRQAGITVEVLHLDGRGRPAIYARRWRDVRNLAARSHFDVVHAQWGQSALVALPKVAPLVITFRGSDVEGVVGPNGRHGLSSLLLTKLSKWASLAADEVIVVSERLGALLPQRRCHVIPSGLDLDLFTPMPKAAARQRLGLDPTRRYVLFAASPSNPVKRHALAIAAMRALSAPDDIDLLVVSGVAPTLMPHYMSACDLLLLTSTHEGSPNVVKEALACNLPVVAVNVGDVAARIGAVAGCVVCGADDPNTIAAAIRAVLARNERVAGRDSVLELDERVLTARVIAVYEQAIARHRRGWRTHAR
jgi:teichuronic acid biosynthesis glycosyltransferase TuaC